MISYAALLRAVNVGGRKVSMADLRTLCTKLGFADPRTLIQSGNLVFRSASKSAADIERRLESEAADAFGFAIDFHLRNAKEMDALIAGNPFKDAARHDPGHLLVFFLKRAPKPADVAALQSAVVGREVVKVSGKHAFIVFPDGIGRSKLTTTIICRRIGAEATGRNWNTVLKLRAMMDDDA